MIRPARPGDVPVIHRLIRELAEYEQEPKAVVSTEADLHAALFSAHPAVFEHIPEHTENGGGGTTRAGLALGLRNASGTHGIYLEDLYVRPELRGRGYGKALLAELAAICVDRGYSRLEWSVLDWNKPAIDFYRSLGAVPMDGWTVFRLTADDLTALGTG